MENFKEIAEKCLSGELSGTFVTAFGNNWHSNYLQKPTIFGHEIPGQYVLGPGVIYNEIGQCESRKHVKIIDFIPDNMAEQIKIDIPEGMEVIQEETPDGIKIRFIKKLLSYKDIENKLPLHTKIQTQYFWNSNVNECYFSKRIEVLRKLTNIRNYFGEPSNKSGTYGWVVDSDGIAHEAAVEYPHLPVFVKKEHAEQAIKMLGDELKYLFEPW